MGYVLAHGACVSCGRLFSFNPAKVPSIRVLNGKPDPKGTREPICKTCMVITNKRRESMGLKPHHISSDAYEAADESVLGD